MKKSAEEDAKQFPDLAQAYQVGVSMIPQIPQEALRKPQETLNQPSMGFGTQMQSSPQVDLPGGRQGSILSKAGPITQAFGNVNPAVERFSKGVNYGTDIGVPEGTTVALPQGKWQIVEAFSGAAGRGHIGDGTNRGYGNSVLARNIDTGEQLRFSHLSQVGVKPGQTVEGGNIIGATGATGNATGDHLDLEYYDQAGKLADVMQSLYRQYLGTGGQGGGNPFVDTVGNVAKGITNTYLYNPQTKRAFPQSPLYDLPQDNELGTPQAVDKWQNVSMKTAMAGLLSSPSEEMVTLYHASPKMPTEGNWRKGTYFADTEQNARYYASSHHVGDIDVQKVEIPKRLLHKNNTNNIHQLLEEYPIKQSISVTQPNATPFTKDQLKQFVKSGKITIGQYQQMMQAPELTAYENAVNSGDKSAMQRMAQQHAGDARFQVGVQKGVIHPDDAKEIGQLYNKYTKSPEMALNVHMNYTDLINGLYQHYLKPSAQELKNTSLADKLDTLYRVAAEDFRNMPTHK